jgi:hypothetical protein
VLKIHGLEIWCLNLVSLKLPFQAPQGYCDYQDNAFKAICYIEYKGFFHIGMIIRNAIIQHGTMTMVRGDALEEK